MAMVQAAMHEFMHHALSPAAILTGGASLPITSAKAMRDTLNPQAPVAQPAQAAPQAAKTPDRAGVGGATAGAAGPGGATGGTFLTGPAGVDPNSLNLGRNTLLGQ